MLGSGLSWKSYFAIIVSSKAFSVYGEETDPYIIKDSDMPPWMNLDTLYLFTFDHDKDDSEFKKSVTGNQFTVIEPVQNSGDLKGNYNFLIETKNKFFFFGVKYCKEMNKWLTAVRKAKSNMEEISRTKANFMYKNIDPIISLYKQKVRRCKSENRRSSENLRKRADQYHRTSKYGNFSYLRIFKNCQDSADWLQSNSRCVTGLQAVLQRSVQGVAEDLPHRIHQVHATILEQENEGVRRMLQSRRELAFSNS